MKIVHINKKDIEMEQAFLEEGRALLTAQAKREYQSFLIRRGKYEVSQKKKPHNGASETSGN